MPKANLKFLIWSNEHGRWWAPHSYGYTHLVSEAGRYSAIEADEIVNNSQSGPDILNGIAPEVAVPDFTTVKRK